MRATLLRMNPRRWGFRRPILVATALVTGALLGILPAASASAATATYTHTSRMMGSNRIYLLTFVVTNDTSEPDYDWKVEFDLPLDTWPAPWPSPQVHMAFADIPNGRHVTVSRFSGNPYPIPPGGSFQFVLPMGGSSAPTNCVVDGTVPCANITP
jgi:hypothetical protein